MYINNEALCFQIKEHLRVYRDSCYMCRFSRIAIDCVCIRVVTRYGVVRNVEADDDGIVAITGCRFIKVKNNSQLYYQYLTNTYFICILIFIAPK